ncbi:MAG: ABC transporter ATP-binding protein [Planctomycetes bacterium]|nr:ABC transporter ATP-binding protein [Planctomycetota bacterium]
MIEVRGLWKDYGGRDALRGVTFTVRPGEVTGYLGPNGAGKTTTLKVIAGLLRPSQGSVAVCGFDVETQPLEARRRLGYVPETAALYTALTPHEHLSMAAELHGLERASAAERMRHLLEAFDLAGAADEQIEALSKGMRQKVLLIGALLHDPEVLLLDEPLNGLDVKAVLTLREILDGMARRGKAILFSSHILPVVERLCSRAVVLHEGLVVADDATSRLLAREPGGTLESVFRSLTGAEAAQEELRAFFEALAPREAR